MRVPKGSSMGPLGKWLGLAVLGTVVCCFLCAAVLRRGSLRVGQQPEVGMIKAHGVGTVRLLEEIGPEIVSREVEGGKEGKRAKKPSNLEMLGEHEMPAHVREEVRVLIDGAKKQAQQEERELFECDRQSPLTDICTLRGDVRVNLQTGEIVLYAQDPQTPRGVLSARPHPRKWDYNVMRDVTQLRLISKDAASSKGPASAAVECTSHSQAPGVIFSAGGYSGGTFHDFNEVFLPLFQTVQAFARDAVLLVTDLKSPWWWRGVAPANTLVGAMTRHPIRLLGQQNDTTGAEQGVECFSHVIVGLRHHLCMYDEFGGLETRSENLAGVRLHDFGPFVAQGLHLDAAEPERVAVPEGRTPVVGIVQRRGTRVLLNFEAMLSAAERVGYRAVVLLLDTLSPEEVVLRVREVDVLVGVHGAGLANVALMRPGGVVMQILPYGEWGKGRLVGREFRTLADFHGAKYLEWHVPLQDTSLMEVYPLTGPILMDPDSVWREQHTVEAMRIYHNQNVSMPEDMFGAYLRHILKDLHFKETLRAEYAAAGQTEA